MTKFEQNIQETAIALDIDEKQALVLEFLYSQTLANLSKNSKAQAIFHVALQHASGKIDSVTKDQLLGIL